MKAAYYDRFGSVDVLNVGDLPAPRPGSGEAHAYLETKRARRKIVLTVGR